MSADCVSKDRQTTLEVYDRGAHNSIAFTKNDTLQWCSGKKCLGGTLNKAI